MKRSAAREVAVRLCYSAEVAAMENADFVADFFAEDHYKTLAAEDELFATAPDALQMNYINKLVALVFEHKESLNEQIERFSKGWSLKRISKISLAIMRCALCEILYMDDVPEKVAINEAVNLAKKYEEPETVSFINGVLGSFTRAKQENA
ncbi:MAG: transcription antitermination factor NusB [Oscillospiraceae bacterium]|nr:transcription antitermination factor NusB [Oscillospiraceae bacterium]